MIDQEKYQKKPCPKEAEQWEISLEYLGAMESNQPLKNMKVGNTIVIKPNNLLSFQNNTKVEKTDANFFEHGISIGAKGKQSIDICLESDEIQQLHAVLMPI